MILFWSLCFQIESDNMIHNKVKLVPLRSGGLSYRSVYGRKVRAGKSSALWKAQIGEEFMQG